MNSSESIGGLINRILGISLSVLPRNLRPMRLSRRSEPFDSNDYIFELKIDGFRSVAYIENSQCDLLSRNGNTFRNFVSVQIRPLLTESM